MSHCIFDHRDYKEYLVSCFPTHGLQRGSRARLARKLSSQPAYVSQVLNGTVHFTLEQAVLIDEFLKHSAKESDYFMLMVQLGRAGTQKLKNYFLRQMQHILRHRQEVGEKIRVKKTLTELDAVNYYGKWYISAIHVLASIPQLQSRSRMSDHLQISLSHVNEAVDFLIRIGLLEERRGKLCSTERRVHLANHSPMIARHHANWRLKAIQAIDRGLNSNLHYSGPIAISQKNATRIKTKLLEAIQTMEPLLSETNEESGYCVSIDFFEI